MHNPDEKLEELGYSRPNNARRSIGGIAGHFDGNTIYASGQIPFDGEVLVSKGKVPSEVSVDEAIQAAALCAANVLRAVRTQFGSLGKVERVIRITGYVNADPDFTDEHLVIDGASQLALDVFGKRGCHARTALGVAQLRLVASTEIEMILKLQST
jgi:enamine deaminase RidA (YjgF/YER057c/UK114 family)